MGDGRKTDTDEGLSGEALAITKCRSIQIEKINKFMSTIVIYSHNGIAKNSADFSAQFFSQKLNILLYQFSCYRVNVCPKTRDKFSSFALLVAPEKVSWNAWEEEMK